MILRECPKCGKECYRDESSIRCVNMECEYSFPLSPDIVIGHNMLCDMIDIVARYRNECALNSVIDLQAQISSLRERIDTIVDDMSPICVEISALLEARRTES